MRKTTSTQSSQSRKTESRRSSHPSYTHRERIPSSPRRHAFPKPYTHPLYASFTATVNSYSREIWGTVVNSIRPTVSTSSTVIPLGIDASSEVVYLSGLVMALRSLEEGCVTHLTYVLARMEDSAIPWTNSAFREALRSHPSMQQPTLDALPLQPEATPEEITTLILKLIGLLAMIH